LTFTFYLLGERADKPQTLTPAIALAQQYKTNPTFFSHGSGSSSLAKRRRKSIESITFKRPFSIFAIL
jgi:hypothetical protein